MFTTWEFYNEVYLMNTPPLISEDLFLKYAQFAWHELNFKNLEFDENWEVPIYIQMAICGYAELLYLSGLTQEQRLSGVRSFSNDGYSISYGETSQMELAINLEKVRVKYIAFTPYHNHFINRSLSVG